MRAITRVFTGAIALALVLGATLAHAQPQWAVTAALDKIFVVQYDGGSTFTNTAVASYLPGASLSGVAVWNNYVFAADESSPAGFLRVGQLQDALGTPRIDWISNVPLEIPHDSSDYLHNPSSIAVDAYGGVYVLGSRWVDSSSNGHSSYAYIPNQDNTWSADGIRLFNMPTAIFTDIATSGNGSQAVIAQRDLRDPNAWADQSWVSAINSGGTANTVMQDDGGYYPRGIASGTNGYSYMVNYSTDTQGEGPVDVGSISVINTLTGASLLPTGGAIQTAGFRPTDISFFTHEGINYLGLVGITSDGKNQAWRISLDPATGMPLIGAATKFDLDNSTDQFCTVSSDGTMFWVTDPMSGSITAINTATWLGVKGYVLGSPGRVASYVPEPGSLVALMAGCIGLIGAIKRKRQ